MCVCKVNHQAPAGFVHNAVFEHQLRPIRSAVVANGPSLGTFAKTSALVIVKLRTMAGQPGLTAVTKFSKFIKVVGT